jgi:hypothetical protein
MKVEWLYGVGERLHQTDVGLALVQIPGTGIAWTLWYDVVRSAVGLFPSGVVLKVQVDDGSVSIMEVMIREVRMVRSRESGVRKQKI